MKKYRRPSVNPKEQNTYQIKFTNKKSLSENQSPVEAVDDFSKLQVLLENQPDKDDLFYCGQYNLTQLKSALSQKLPSESLVIIKKTIENIEYSLKELDNKNKELSTKLTEAKLKLTSQKDGILKESNNLTTTINKSSAIEESQGVVTALESNLKRVREKLQQRETEIAELQKAAIKSNATIEAMRVERDYKDKVLEEDRSKIKELEEQVSQHISLEEHIAELENSLKVSREHEEELLKLKEELDAQLVELQEKVQNTSVSIPVSVVETSDNSNSYKFTPILYEESDEAITSDETLMSKIQKLRNNTATNEIEHNNSIYQGRYNILELEYNAVDAFHSGEVADLQAEVTLERQRNSQLTNANTQLQQEIKAKQLQLKETESKLNAQSLIYAEDLDKVKNSLSKLENQICTYDEMQRKFDLYRLKLALEWRVKDLYTQELLEKERQTMEQSPVPAEMSSTPSDIQSSQTYNFTPIEYPEETQESGDIMGNLHKLNALIRNSADSKKSKYYEGKYIVQNLKYVPMESCLEETDKKLETSELKAGVLTAELKKANDNIESDKLIIGRLDAEKSELSTELKSTQNQLVKTNKKLKKTEENVQILKEKYMASLQEIEQHEVVETTLNQRLKSLKKYEKTIGIIASISTSGLIAGTILYLMGLL